MSMSAAIYAAVIGAVSFPQIVGGPPAIGVNAFSVFCDEVYGVKSLHSPDWSGVGSPMIDTQETHFGNPTMLFGSLDVTNEIGAVVDTDQSAVFNFGGGVFTVEAWVKPVTGLSNYPIFGRHGESLTSTRGWMLSITSTGRLRFDYRTNASSSLQSYTTGSSPPVNLFDGNFHHVCFMRHDSTFYFFVDGIVFGSIAAFFMYNSGTNFPTIGSNSDRRPTMPNRMFMGEVRSSRVARYAPSGFTPPATVFPKDGTGDADFSSVEFIMDWKNRDGIYGGIQMSSAFFSVENRKDFSTTLTLATAPAYPNPITGYNLGFDGTGYTNATSLNNNTGTIPADGRWDFGSEDFTLQLVWGWNGGSLAIGSLVRQFGPITITNPLSTSTASVDISFAGHGTAMVDFGSRSTMRVTITRSGSVVKFFKNTSLLATVNLASPSDTLNGFNVMHYHTNNTDFRGCKFTRGQNVFPDDVIDWEIDDLRIVG